jgi:hypothetical protein
VDAARGGGCVNEMRWILLQCSTKLSLVDMPLWHVHRRLQRACLSTHKTLLRWCFFFTSANHGGSVSLPTWF